MRSTLILAALGGFFGLGVSQRQETFQINQERSEFQACFIEGHEYWFCSKYLPGQWQNYTGLIPVGCGYRFEFIKNDIVEVTSDNGWYCGYKSHCELNYNREEGMYTCDIITDSPNCRMRI